MRPRASGVSASTSASIARTRLRAKAGSSFVDVVDVGEAALPAIRMRRCPRDRQQRAHQTQAADPGVAGMRPRDVRAACPPDRRRRCLAAC